MIVVREVLIAKPGMAGKLARMMKAIFSEMPNSRMKVMTDLTGKFNKVVMETEMDSLQAFEQRMQDYASNPMWRDKMSGYTEMYREGYREIYQII